MRTETITSGQNPKIRELVALQEKSRLRRDKGLFVVEGRRELGHCINAGFKVRTLFVCREIIPEQDLKELTEKIQIAAHRSQTDNEVFPASGNGSAETGPGTEDSSINGKRGSAGKEVRHHGSPDRPGGWRDRDGLNVIEIPAVLYGKVAYREGTEGVIAEMEYRERTLESLVLKENPLIAVLESVEKPGNLGAVLRSADAAGADAVIVCDPLTDLYNPNLIRASIGAVFSRQVAVASSEDTIRWLKDNGIRILTAQLQDSEWYYDTDMTNGTAIVMGTEATGLSGQWRQAADAHIKIPMLGQLDSLNVSVSAAILLYEAVRQRHACNPL